ncbi:MAG: RyR domain-containing protein [Oscillospiraceae bacterium]|nr:RyR domain-containing protein [Oscillospiraceae bacterium]
MINTDYIIIGHAWDKIFSYTELKQYNSNYKCREFHMPGGAALLAQLLGIEAKLDNNATRERLRLYRYKIKQKKGGDRDYYAVHCQEGFIEGSRVPVLFGTDGQKIIAWAEDPCDWSKLSLPDTGPVLWVSQNALPDEKQIRNIDTLVLDADLLRQWRNGAMISRGISWERTVIDLLRQLRNNADLMTLLQVPEILILFSEDGAILLKNKNSGTVAELYLHNGLSEGAQRYDHEKSPGIMPDAFTVMAAEAARQFNAMNEIDDVHRILRVGGKLLGCGYVLNNDEIQLFEKSGTEGLIFAGEGSPAGNKAIEIPVDKTSGEVDADWCIARDSISGFRSMWDMIREYNFFEDGPPTALPRLTFNYLTTVDRREIESYQDIYSAIKEYAEKNFGENDDICPLSLAVFGPPGAGKSFGVKQIAGALSKNIVKKEYNVSQFRSEDDVARAFQDVRSLVLQGKLPLVFFDEFDSRRGDVELGWLKSFLMPMQDGLMNDGTGTHPIGKCILVFAGGTKSCFADFERPMNLKEDNPEYIKFKNAKGPDFVSRLRGTLDILGPNKRDVKDSNFLLRRAVLLNGQLAQAKLRLSKNVREAMLLIPEYRHGARSMKQILDMSHSVDGMINAACLPSEAQLNLHVDGRAFLALVQKDVTLQSKLEDLAKKIHSAFCEENPDSSNNMAWEKLPGNIQEDNRRQAQEIPQFLDVIVCDYDAADPKAKTIFETVDNFNSNEIERLAIRAHEVWMNGKIIDGWVYGLVKDPDAKPNPTHPCLLSWEELPEEEKKKDRDIAENIIPQLQNVGLRVYRVM